MKQLNFILLLSLAIPFFTFAQTVPECTLPFISEMIDGHPKNKVLEIYNPSEFPIDASDLAVLQFNNGNNTPIAIPLSGIIAPKQTFVLANQNANSSILANTDQVSNKLNFNGNDAIALVYTGMLPPDLNEFPVPQNAFIDIIGEIGVNPGNSGWAVGGGGSTSNYGLRRKEEVKKPEMNWGLSRMQWTSTATTATSNLGQHVSECATRQTATIGFVEENSSYSEDYYNTSLGTNTIFLEIFVTGAHADIDIFVREGAIFSACGPDYADGTDYNVTTSSIHVPASSGGEIIQAEIILTDDSKTEPDESICLDLECLSVSENCFVDMDACCHELIIIDNDGTGIEDAIFGNLNIYPSLVNQNLYIEGLKLTGEITVTISNIVGQKVRQKFVQSNQDKIVLNDIGDLEKGMYFVTIGQENKTITKKFIKN